MIAPTGYGTRRDVGSYVSTEIKTTAKKTKFLGHLHLLGLKETTLREPEIAKVMLTPRKPMLISLVMRENVDDLEKHRRY